MDERTPPRTRRCRVLGRRIVRALTTLAVAGAGATGAAIVNPAPAGALPATQLVLSAPVAEAPNTQFAVQVAAKDVNGNVDTTFADQVRITSSDPNALLPSPAALTHGAGSFFVTLATRGTQTLTVSDLTNGAIRSSTVSVTVGNVGAATHLSLGAPTIATPGVPFSVVVTLRDASNQVVTGPDVVRFSSSDPLASLPAQSSLENGQGVFSVTLQSAGSTVLAVSDATNSAIVGDSKSITVGSSSSATHLVLTAPGTATPGTAFPVTVTLEDSLGRVVSGSDVVQLTSSDPAAVLPPAAALANGTGTFSVTLNTVGSAYVSVSDTSNATVTGSYASITVGPLGAATHLTLFAPGATTPGVPFYVTCWIQDALGRTVTGAADVVRFFSSDPAAILPPATTLVNGVGTFAVTLYSTGSQTLSVNDLTNPGVLGGTATILNGAGAPSLVVTPPTTITPGTPFNFTVTAYDAAGAVLTNLADVVQFASTDPAAALPATTALTNGTGVFTATFNTPGTQTLIVTDASNPSVAGGAAPVLVGTGKPVARVAGTDRVGTAIVVSQRSFIPGAADGVVIARADDFADALAGGPLAAAKNAPLLLNPSGALDPNVANEIRRVLPLGGTVYLLGGQQALSEAVASGVAGMGYVVTRLAGTDRYDTAVRIATTGLGNPHTVLLATGRDFADALAGGPAAIKLGGALLLTDGATMPSATSGYLASHNPTTYALGGPAAAAAPGATAIVGVDRYETAAKVAAKWFSAPSVIAVASGANFPDALAGSVHVGHLGGPMLLVDPSRTSLPSAVQSYLTTVKGSVFGGFAYGGNRAVSDALVAATQSAIG